MVHDQFEEFWSVGKPLLNRRLVEVEDLTRYFDLRAVRFLSLSRLSDTLDCRFVEHRLEHFVETPLELSQ